MARFLCSLMLSVLVLLAHVVPATAHEDYAPGLFLRFDAGAFIPTQDTSNDYTPGFAGSAGAGFFLTPSVRLEGDFIYTLTLDPSDDGSAPGDLILLAGEGRLGYEFTASSDATPYIELLAGYYSFGIEDAEGEKENYGAMGVGGGLGMVAYPEFFSGSLDIAVRYRYVFSSEDEDSAVDFLEEGHNCSFLTISAGVTFNF